jgi:hypothetical protein
MVARVRRRSAVEAGSQRPAASRSREGRLDRWRPRIPVLLAAVLFVAAVAPALHSSMRGDDSHVGIDGNGYMRAEHVSLAGYVRDVEDFMLDTGRVMPIGVAQGQVYAAKVPERFPFKLGIVLMSLACIAALVLLLRSLRIVSRDVFIIAAVAFALSLQFRATHDPMLGYNASPQLTVLELLLGLIAYWRYLETGSWRWYAASIAAVVILLLTYEANHPLVLAFAALHLGRQPRRVSSWKPVFPILAIGVAMTLLSAYLHSRATTVIEGYQDSLDLIVVAQTAVRQALSAIPDIYFVSGSQGLLADPTRAELFAAFWRAGLTAALVVLVLLGLRRPTGRPAIDGAGKAVSVDGDRTSSAALQVGAIGVVMMTCSGLYISLAKQHQDLIFLGGGHLATFAGTIGFVLLAVAAWLVVRRTLSRSLVVIWSLGFLVFWMAFATSYSNFRVVAIEQPGIEQRKLINQALDHGILEGVRKGTTLYLTSRDMNWNFGNLIFYGSTADYLVYLRTGLKLDVRTLGPPSPACGPPLGFPSTDCVIPSRRVALLAVRGSRGGGTVVLAGGIPSDHINDRGARTLTALARDASATGREPSLVGTRPDGSPWAAADEDWTRQTVEDGWVRYTTRVGAADGPLAASITDPRSQIDFTSVTNTPGSLVRLFGTKRLLP